MSEDWPGNKIKLNEFAADLTRGRAEYEAKSGHSVDAPMPRNSGNRRTESKRALLKTIKGAGGSW